MANKFVLNETSYHGAGAISAVPEEIKARGFKKAFVASDPDLVKFNVTSKVTDLLDKEGIAYTLYSDIKPNPTIENVQHGVQEFKASGADCIVAIGGGSSMDTAKAIGIIIANPEYSDVTSLEGVADTKNPCVPLIAVPTTAGTAAEVTINYVITDEDNKRKFVCVDPHDIPIVAVVDSQMMSSMPKGLTAATGMDALTHAIEGYTTLAAWELTDMMHLKAIEIIARSLRKAVANDPEGREDMALGQYVAGMGFSNVGLGVVHGMAHPLGSFYDTPHGIANAVLLPYVMEYNAPCTGEKFKYIAEAMGVDTAGMSPDEYRAAAVGAGRLADHRMGVGHARAVRHEIDRVVLVDADAPGGLHRVDVGAEEEEFPVVGFLLSRHHFPHLVRGVAVAGIFITVGGDHEERPLRQVLRPDVFVDLLDVGDGLAERVDQGGAAADGVFLFRHCRDLPQVDPVVDDLALIAEQHRRDQRFALFLLLLLDHAVESADGVGDQARHGAAPVQNKNHFCKSLFHVDPPCCCMLIPPLRIKI